MHRVSYVLVFMLVGEEVLTRAITRWQFRVERILSLESFVIDQKIIYSKKYKRQNCCKYTSV